MSPADYLCNRESLITKESDGFAGAGSWRGRIYHRPAAYANCSRSSRRPEFKRQLTPSLITQRRANLTKSKRRRFSIINAHFDAHHTLAAPLECNVSIDRLTLHPNYPKFHAIMIMCKRAAVADWNLISRLFAMQDTFCVAWVTRGINSTATAELTRAAEDFPFRSSCGLPLCAAIVQVMILS